MPHAGPMPKTFEEIIAIQDVEKDNKIRNSKTKMLYESIPKRKGDCSAIFTLIIFTIMKRIRHIGQAL
ncbi:hypothetical protein J4710_07700 [Staphylococcus xylosus]|uniref:Uncharacterized protein n=1 Tax=Staphylococcus xylosus TaxID=1288 RepID=A0A939NIW5_STAXY|nr:hypothetical protein [Staphylococcus xylosus]